MTAKTTRSGRGHGFGKVLEWSAYKHRLLKKYVRVWCYKLGVGRAELAFVDTCAGAGKYGDGEDGSPLIAARCNDDPAMIKRGTRVTVYAFESDPDVFPELAANLASYSSLCPPRAFPSNESFFENPQRVLAATRSLPTLFFVDPFGTEEVTLDRLQPILSDGDRASTELLVRIDPTMLARYAGWVRRQSRTTDRVPGAAAFERLLKRLNIDTQQLADESGSNEQAYQSKNELLDQYLRFYTEHFEYVQVVPVRGKYDAAPKYMLVHASDSPHGAAHLNDVVSTIEDELFEDTEERKDSDIGQGALFGPPPRPPQYTTSELDEATYSLVVERGQVTFIDVRAELAMTFGPDFREKHHKAAVNRLAKAGSLQIVVGGPPLESTTILRALRAPSN